MIELDSQVLGLAISSLGWTLLHFLWQGAVVGVLFGISLAVAARCGPRTRYHIGLFFLAVLAALPVVTFLWLKPDFDLAAADTAALTVAAGSSLPAAASPTDWRAIVDPYLPWTVLVWGFGVLLMTARLLLEWRAIRRLTRLDVEPLSAEWQARVVRLRERLEITRLVQVLCSARVHVPMVVGWLRPVVLVPVSAFTGLTPWQLELILMHELAHVRRHDYLVNLLQVVVETLLFYHPVVRWVSRVVREEREHCCDDLVVARTGDPLNYASALAELAGAQSLGLQTSVGSDGGKLLVRIKRLVLAHEPRRVSTHWSVGAMLAAFGMSMSSLVQPGAQRVEEPPELAVPEAVAPEGAVGAGTALAVRAESSVPAPADPLREITTMVTPVPEPVPAQWPIAPAASEQGSAVAPDAPAPVATAAVAPALVATAMARAFGASVPSATQVAPAAREIPAPASVAPAPAPPKASGTGPELTSAPLPEAVATAMAATTPATTTPAAKAPAATGAAPEREQAGSAPIASPPPASAARPLSGKTPEFPVDARLDGVEGWVKFSYTIDRDGGVRNVKILDAEPRHVFESAVRRAVRSWRFEPVLVDGRPAEREMTQVIQFALGRAAAETEQCQETGTRLCRKVGD